jgi:CRP-like cAMP-binding protein
MEIADLLRKTPLFADLSDAEISGLTQSTRIEQYKAGHVIIREGRVGAAFFILVWGEVEVIKGIATEEPEVVTVLRAGDFFGEIAVIKHGTRSASVKAIADTTCLVIRRLDLDAYLERYPGIATKVNAVLADRF